MKLFASLFLTLLVVGMNIYPSVAMAGPDSGATLGSGDSGGTLGAGDKGTTMPPKKFSESTQLENPLGNISSIPAFFSAIIDILLVFAIPFVVFFIIYAGFLYVTARGNAETIKKAHNALLYALIGGMLILGANVLLDVITGTVDQIK